MQTLERPAPNENAQQEASPPEIKLPMSVTDIMAVIPHRYPFLLVDQVTDLQPEKWIRGYKNVTINEPFFAGHFPSAPIMPGVLQIEALAQLGAVLIGLTPQCRGKLGLFAGIDNVRFRRMVTPGDRLDLYVELVKFRYPIGKFIGKATVNGEPVMEADLMFSITEKRH